METFVAHTKLHLFWSSLVLILVFTSTINIFCSLNLFQIKYFHPLIDSLKDDVTGKCRLFEGRWVKEAHGHSSLAYTNWSCAAIQDFNNCFKNGRVDTEFLDWRWKPHGCDLPRFDPHKFLMMLRGKTMGFIGDSLSRNHVDSLLCLLSKEEVPIDITKDSNDRSRTWQFPNHNFTLKTFWSRYLVVADEVIVNGSNSGTFNLHIDKPDPIWADKLPTLDYAIVSDGHWFFRQLNLFKNNIKIGCVFCQQPNITNYNITSAMKMSFRTSLRYINEFKHVTTFVRTFSPSHFENGTWNNGGNCVRVKPLRLWEIEASEFYKEISVMQNEEILGKDYRRFKVLDITVAMAMRADGHPGSHRDNRWTKGYNDCLHWCLPGPIDVWNDFLMAYLTQ